MSHDYGQDLPYDGSQTRALPWSDNHVYQPKEGRLRATSSGSFSRRDPPVAQRQPTTAPALPPQNPRRHITPPQRPQRPPDEALPGPPSEGIQESRGPTSAAATSASKPSPNALNNQRFSPVSSRPGSGASIPSTYSSYSLTGAPPETKPQALPSVPPGAQRQKAPPTTPRARVPLGPPPSARRGPSSIYPQYAPQAYVSPIVEESDSQKTSERNSLRPGDGSRTSYASSNAIPIGISDYYVGSRSGRPVDSYASEYDGSDVEMPPSMPQPDRQESPPALVRQASLGKRSKPTLTTIKPAHSRSPSDDSVYDESPPTKTPTQAATEPQPPAAPRPTLRRIQNSAESNVNSSQRTDSSEPLPREQPNAYKHFSSESEDSDAADYKMKEYMSESWADRLPQKTSQTAGDARAAIMSSLAKGGALPTSQLPTKSEPPTSLAQRVGSKRPPRINVDAVREAEQRGSLTSLPDLIRRATKLASNLDRGRTASRLGFDWIGLGDEKRRSVNSQDRRRSGSLSDMISAFPPPAATGTPMSGRFAWPSHLRDEMDKPEDQPAPSRQKHRVCGMRVWVFLLLILLLIVLIAAAVIVPVFLIVVPNQSRNQARSLAACKSSLPCSNAGVSVFSGACHCLCPDGYTGSTCTIVAGPDCTTVPAAGINATAGTSLPRLFSTAESNFSLPLQPATVLSLLASANMSCATQNALVTFGGLAQRDLTPSPTTDNPTITTSAGVVFATGNPSGNGSLVDATQRELDFARVAVLFVLQDSGGVDDAFTAQGALEKRFSGETGPGSGVDLGNGYSADLGGLSVTVRNGTVFGG